MGQLPSAALKRSAPSWSACEASWAARQLSLVAALERPGRSLGTHQNCVTRARTQARPLFHRFVERAEDRVVVALVSDGLRQRLGMGALPLQLDRFSHADLAVLLEDPALQILSVLLFKDLPIISFMEVFLTDSCRRAAPLYQNPGSASQSGWTAPAARRETPRMKPGKSISKKNKRWIALLFSRSLILKKKRIQHTMMVTMVLMERRKAMRRAHRMPQRSSLRRLPWTEVLRVTGRHCRPTQQPQQPRQETPFWRSRRLLLIAATSRLLQ